MGDTFILESDGGGSWYICEWLNSKNFHIVKVFYKKSRAREFLGALQMHKDTLKN